jgi:hypothetical protein
VLLLEPAPVHAAYTRAMGESNGICPYEYVTPDGNYWFDSCSTESGASYDGYVFAYEAVGEPDPYGSGMLTDYWSAFGGAVVTDSAGNVLELSGAITEYHSYGDSGGIWVDAWYVDLSGTFRWDGPEARGTWLEDGYDPDLSWQRTAAAELGAGGVYLTGGYSGLPGGWAVAFDENQVGHELLGYPCTEEPTGTVSVRAPDGAWYDVRFDGWLYGEEGSPAACDGCGRAFLAGDELGRVCVSVDTLLELAARP